MMLEVSRTLRGSVRGAALPQLLHVSEKAVARWCLDERRERVGQRVDAMIVAVHHVGQHVAAEPVHLVAIKLELLRGVRAAWVNHDALELANKGDAILDAARPLRGALDVLVARAGTCSYSGGMSAKRTAEVLNGEGVPSPGSSWARATRRRGGWAPSGINGDPSRGIGIRAVQRA